MPRVARAQNEMLRAKLSVRQKIQNFASRVALCAQMFPNRYKRRQNLNTDMALPPEIVLYTVQLYKSTDSYSPGRLTYRPFRCLNQAIWRLSSAKKYYFGLRKAKSAKKH